jgi:magnesium-protoporphyrin O-methyltransferase
MTSEAGHAGRRDASRSVNATTTPDDFGSFYDEKRAAIDLRKYREGGPNRWTAALIDALKDEGVAGTTLLDIGGGIGAIQHELLAAGVATATSVDASAPYLDAARAEAERRDHRDRVRYVHGDFVDLADSIPAAEIVTLDRVINVYPEWQRLIRLSADRARRLYGLVYPRDTAFVRAAISVLNLKLRGPVRAAIRPEDAIRAILHESGLSPHFSMNAGPVWHMAVYRRDA